MLDDITEADWRAMALHDEPRPPRPILVPGLPAENARRLEAWHCAVVFWRAARAERLRHGLPEVQQCHAAV